MSTAGTVIVGAGHGGFAAASALRQAGYEAPVVLLDAQGGVPYQRPPLSKELLHGDVEPDGVAMRPETFYARKGIELRMGDPAARIDRDAARIELASGATLPYDRLVLATGARTRPLSVPGTELDGVLELRTLDQARRLRERLTSAKAVVVIGGGFIGLEVAAAARRLGAAVTVLEALDRTMARVVTETISDHVAGVHTHAGTDVRHGATVVALADDGSGHVAGVELDDGARVEADLVVLGVGISPNVELALQAGLAVADGVEVDAHLRTQDERIWAIGDCCAFPLPGDGARVRLESVQNATDHGRTVVHGLLGTPAPYDAIPWFWSNQHACRLQIAGLVAGHRETVLRGDPDTGAFSVFCYAGDRLLGVESVNSPRDHLAVRRLLAAGTRLAPEQAADEDCDLKALAA